MARIDLIVVSWNDRDRIGTALDSVLALPEVRAEPGLVNAVVADNGSTDDTRAFVRERYGARVTVIEDGANHGFRAA